MKYRQHQLGRRIAYTGCLLLFFVLLLCCIDLALLKANGRMMIPLSGYLISIFFGVAMQIVGAAVPNMRFAKAGKKK